MPRAGEERASARRLSAVLIKQGVQQRSEWTDDPTGRRTSRIATDDHSLIHRCQRRLELLVKKCGEPAGVSPDLRGDVWVQVCERECHRGSSLHVLAPAGQSMRRCLHRRRRGPRQPRPELRGNVS
jgi:hypothetical protein